ncbi:hypothetical protein [Halobellus ruber]|uniref:Uncharacterized protein n=1 Tax=Halobellus ruber TaxID=2761102 RepID=A0A7J9SJV3_9EURY|nr:hypothetical protein [Halobellus ruber]MBB6646399.1 hypothetical protein [Halobellus ruber]
MSGQQADSTSDAEQDGSAPADSDPTDDTPDASPLQIALPDGSASVSDAIVTHREMLREPQDHGLATDQEITHLSEAMESLSADIQETTQQHDESRSRIEDLEDRVEAQQERIGEYEELVEAQQQQIDELQSMVSSLAGILGTDTEWQTFDDDA